ncbi:hypothetical protein ACOSP7_003548 [Xanthoceras sorbifolium]
MYLLRIHSNPCLFKVKRLRKRLYSALVFQEMLTKDMLKRKRNQQDIQALGRSDVDNLKYRSVVQQAIGLRAISSSKNITDMQLSKKGATNTTANRKSMQQVLERDVVSISNNKSNVQQVAEMRDSRSRDNRNNIELGNRSSINNLETRNNMGNVVDNNLEVTSDDSETEAPSDQDIDEIEDDGGSMCKKTRGRTCLQWLHLQKEPIQVELNAFRQPIGLPGKHLGQYIGFIVGDSSVVPLKFEDWRYMPHETKSRIYDVIKAKFNIDWDLAEDWINKKLDHLWRQRKYRLKKEYEKSSNDNSNKDKEKLSQLINEVGWDQWDWLVKFWNCDKGKDRAKTNKINHGNNRCHPQLKLSVKTWTKTKAFN